MNLLLASSAHLLLFLPVLNLLLDYGALDYRDPLRRHLHLSLRLRLHLHLFLEKSYYPHYLEQLDRLLDLYVQELALHLNPDLEPLDLLLDLRALRVLEE